MVRSNANEVYRGLIQQWVEDGEREKAFIEAVRYRLTDLVEDFLEEGMSVNGKSGSHGCTPLMMAALVASHRLVRRFIDLGADVHIRDEKGGTALIYAVSGLNRETNVLKVVKLLLEAGADITVVDNEGFSPYTLAQSKYTDAVLSLLSD